MDPKADIVDRVEDLTVHERKNLVALLHVLVDTAYDAAEGYNVAANAVHDQNLRDLFRSCSDDRRDAVATLTGLLEELGDTRGPHPSIGGELHSTLIALRGAMERGDATTILAECERGERVSVERYERGIAQRMPMRVASVVLDQLALARAAHTAFERMRHPY